MRIIFDISTVARRSGPPGGIGRVERELANYALKHRPDVAFSIYDHSIGSFRQAKREWISDLIGTESILDLSRIAFSDHERQKWRYRLPSAISNAAFWLRRPRYNVQVALERVRLTSSSTFTRKIASRLLAPLSRVSGKFRQGKFTPAILPFEVAVGEPLALNQDCILVSVGNDWSFKDPEKLVELKAWYKFRYVILCHDLILLQFPELVGERASAFVRKYWERVFPLSDLVFFTTRTVERDVRAFCGENDIRLGATAIVPLGFNPTSFPSESTSELPAGLEPNKYILMVSALDLRKGHDLMISVWKRLVKEGVPQSHGFKLVFVGEYMFNTPHIKEKLLRGAAGPTLVHFHGVSDVQLSTFYRYAAFCIYPSQYEGFGLPAVEALGAGKALIASTGGSIPEVVGGLGPCIDANDEDGWYAEIRRWIVNPDVRSDYEQQVRRDFKMPTWAETGERFFATIDKWASASNAPT